MPKQRRGKLLLTSLITLLPILVGLLLWNRLPDTFATHWGIGGQADGWGSKAYAVFLPPLFMLATHWLCIWVTARDSKNQGRNSKIFNIVLWIIPITSNLSSALVFSLALGLEFSMDRAMQIILGAMFVIIGNYLPKCRMNSTIGIKVPWAYSSEENWNATHRFSGKMWVIGGILIMLSAFLPGDFGAILMILAVFALAILPVFYSYSYYRKQKAQGTALLPMLSQTDLKILKGVSIFIAVLLAVVAFLLFTGDVEIQYEETFFTIEASYYSDMTVNYDAIESIEYRAGNVDGTRVNGVGSFRLLLGFFQNEEFGTYTRYTYYNPEACVILTTAAKTIVLSGKDAAETRLIYTELTNRTEVSK